MFHLAPVAMLVGFGGGVALQPAQVSAEAKLHTGRTGQTEKAKVVFFLTSGLEDVEQMRISLAHAKAARQSGFLGDVVWLAADRGAEVLGAQLEARPGDVAQHAREAQASGVRIVVSNSALKRLGIDPGKAEPSPDEVVPSGIVKLAELIAQGYEVIRY